MIKMYGITNCDTVKKSRSWFNQHNIDFEFIDYRVKNIDKAHLLSWIKQVGWESLINKRSKTWHQLNDSVKSKIDEKSAIHLMLKQPTLIKRPVIEYRDLVIVGFDVSQYEQHFI